MLCNRVRVLGMLAAGAIFAMAGCAGENVGWMLKPVPLDEELTESVLASDATWLDPTRIVVVDVDGLLVNERQKGFLGLGDNPVSLFAEKIDKAQADPRVKALIVRINSPGGGVTASDIMYRRLMQFRQARKAPVIAIIEDVGASGGYYLACAADAILAHPTSVTGSIGVMVQTVSFAGTMEKLGITGQAVTSGPHKDMASPLKPLAKEDLAILQQIVDRYHRRFVGVVASARAGLRKDQLAALTDGRVFAASQAAKEGLIDGLGYMDDAIALAKSRAGIARARVVMYHRPLGSKASVYSRLSVPAPQVNLLNITLPDVLSWGRPRFMYLWTGKR